MTLHRLAPPTTAATFHAMARDAHREAVRLKLAGDDAGYAAKWRDVLAFDEQAMIARQREDRLRAQIEERRGMCAAVTAILEAARKAGA